MKINGKVAIITGASSGFGEALSIRLVNNGAKVVLGDVTDEAGLKLADSLNKKFPGCAVYQHCNVTVKAEQEALFKLARDTFGKIDVFYINKIVVNNAGIAEKELFTSNVQDTWKLIIDIDLTAVILGTRLAISEFKKQNSGGVILNTASMAGLVVTPFQPVYAGAKAGVVNFSNSLGYLAKTDNIRVIPICPLFAKTKMTDMALEHGVEIKQWVTVDMVIDAFVMGIEDESIAGESIRITPKFGIDIPNRKNRSKI